MDISVVIAVRNDRCHIRECLESLWHQTRPPLEIIVTDGDSSDGTREYLEQPAAGRPAIRLLHNPAGDAASGRNLGIAHARGNIIAFIDSDATAEPDWIDTIASRFAALSDERIAGIGGPDIPVCDGSPVSRAINIVLASPLASGGSLNPSVQHRVVGEECAVRHIPTCNLAVGKELFLKEGVFDPLMYKAEDLEFSTRLCKRGYRFLYSPAIRVLHHKKTSIKAFARQIFKWGYGKALVMKKHGPEPICIAPILAVLTVLISVAAAAVRPDLIAVPAGFLTAYAVVIAAESARLAGRSMRLIPLLALLLAVVHGAGTAGIVCGLLNRPLNIQHTEKK